MAADKSEGPVKALVYLGIVIDTMAGELQLPHSKLQRLKTLLQQWGTKRVSCRRELESLIDLLNHACKVMHPRGGPLCSIMAPTPPSATPDMAKLTISAKKSSENFSQDRSSQLSDFTFHIIRRFKIPRQ